MTTSAAPPPLDASKTFRGARLLVIGGTGFLGKIFLSMLLDRFPEVGSIHMVVRRGASATPEARFWESIASSPVLGPLRARHGEGYESFLRQRVFPIDGDVRSADCGIDAGLLAELAGKIDAVVNVAGVVDFNPPLDEALRANAFGAQNLIALARRLGQVPVMHTSTCYVAGSRKGPIDEVDPRTYPFPRCDELAPELWDPDREIAECLDLISQARHRADDAFRQSAFAEQARKNLEAKGEPVSGKPYEQELADVKRRFMTKRLVDSGLERATHWGWPNIYTYTKSIGEQVVARSGLPFTIVRPACSESCESFPSEGWNEGVNTSAPLIYLSLKGLLQLPGSDVSLDFIPADIVCAGMILSLCELLDGTHKPVYQYGASDINPCASSRIGELIGLYKRRYYQKKGTGSPLVNFVQAHYEPAVISEALHEKIGPRGIARAAAGAASLLRKASVGPAASVLKPAARALSEVSAKQERIGQIVELFAPFTARPNGPFSCANTRAAYARLSEEDRAKLPWTPEKIDWAHWMLDVHMPGLERWVLPEMDKKLERKVRPARPHHTLCSMLDQMVERHGHAVALLVMTPEGLSPVTYRELGERARAAGLRLREAGVGKGARVLLGGANHPSWAIAYFGVLLSGGTAVPVDPQMEPAQLAAIAQKSGARVAVLDRALALRVGAALGAAEPALLLRDLSALAEPGPGLSISDEDLAEGDTASLIYTSGTTGTPKGVMLTHGNFTALLGSLSPVFPLTPSDRLLSVLPLHHTFEFTCGLLLPLSRGARVLYLDELSGERLAEGLKKGRITGMVGVPALFQMLERRILSEVAAQGPVAEALFKAGGELNGALGRTLGLDAGRLLFGSVHAALGGNIKYLISGGAALPGETHRLFASLGLPLSEGYGLTEAAPVLTVARPSPGGRPGHVGKPLPGVEIRVVSPDAQGVGEVLARGPNVMAGYEGDAAATAGALDAGGWLHTGDLGKLDKRGQLSLVGRVKDVVITSAGENLYPDDIERMLGPVAHVKELVVLGLKTESGGERLACLAVPVDGDSADRDLRLEKAERALREAIGKLPTRLQPSVVHLHEASLPRTSTRKVKRGEVQALLARRLSAAAAARFAPANGRVAALVAAISRRPPREISAASSLAGDLGFDSLMMVELQASLEALSGRLDPAKLLACRTVGDLESLLEDGPAAEPAPVPEPKSPRVLPAFLQQAGKRLLGSAQHAFYAQMMKPRVTGRAFIPHNRNVIVVANHASHLDMGFVKYALGSYGDEIVALAAQDYFFEEGTLRRAYVENLTNLKALDRKGGVRQGLRQAGEVIEAGKTVLVFPEGTRSTDGQIGEFKPLLGQLALGFNVDLLPVYLGGTHEAMPKGQTLPSRREIQARIGPPLEVAELRRRTAGMSWSDAAREVARLAQRAVLALRDGGVLDLGREGDVLEEQKHPLVLLFEELEGKFQPGRVQKPVSYYFTLGVDKEAKWTVRVDAGRCEIRPGKPEGFAADCVLKTSPEIFTRIVRDAYTPGVAEFLSGAIKSNDVELLQVFQQAFALA